jgi:hypothetical protein
MTATVALKRARRARPDETKRERITVLRGVWRPRVKAMKAGKTPKETWDKYIDVRAFWAAMEMMETSYSVMPSPEMIRKSVSEGFVGVRGMGCVAQIPLPEAMTRAGGAGEGNSSG